MVSYWLGKPRDTMHILYFIFLYQKTREKYTTTMNMHPLSCSRRVSDGRKITYFPPRRGCEFNFSKVSRQLTFKTFPPRRGFEFNFSKVSRQDEGSNSTFQKFPAKTRVRFLRWCKNGGMKSETKIANIVAGKPGKTSGTKMAGRQVLVSR